MEILLKTKSCIFTQEVLVTKKYSDPIAYAQIRQVIYEKRHNTYDIVFYDEKGKKRTVEIDCSNDKENEEAILMLLEQKVRHLEPRSAKRPIWQAGAFWIILYALLSFIVLFKFFAGPPQNVSIPLLLYPLFLVANMVPSETFSTEQLVMFLLRTAGLTLVLFLFSYIRSSIVIYEKKEP